MHAYKYVPYAESCVRWSDHYILASVDETAYKPFLEIYKYYVEIVHKYNLYDI